MAATYPDLDFEYEYAYVDLEEYEFDGNGWLIGDDHTREVYARGTIQLREPLYGEEGWSGNPYP